MRGHEEGKPQQKRRKSQSKVREENLAINKVLKRTVKKMEALNLEKHGI